MKCKAAIAAMLLLVCLLATAVSGAPVEECRNEVAVAVGSLTVALEKGESWTLCVREQGAVLARVCVKNEGKQQVGVPLPGRDGLVVYLNDSGIVAVRG